MSTTSNLTKYQYQFRFLCHVGYTGNLLLWQASVASFIHLLKKYWPILQFWHVVSVMESRSENLDVVTPPSLSVLVKTASLKRQIFYTLGWSTKIIKDQCLLRPGEKSENSKFKMFGLNVSFHVLTLTWKKYQCSKLNTYLVTTFLSEWGYCDYIEIPLRLSPAPTFRALKYMSAVMLHFLTHICEYRMTWSIDHLNKEGLHEKRKW